MSIPVNGALSGPGVYPPYICNNFPVPGRMPFPPVETRTPGSKTVYNMPDTLIKERRDNPFAKKERVDGYGLDLDGDGTFEKGQDGILAFDLDSDGKVSDDEASDSNKILKSLGGDFDFDRDGKVTDKERREGQKWSERGAALDQDHNGRLEGNELVSAHARVWVDGDRDGRMDDQEMHGVGGLPGGERIDSVDLSRRSTELSSPDDGAVSVDDGSVSVDDGSVSVDDGRVSVDDGSVSVDEPGAVPEFEGYGDAGVLV